MSYRTSGGVPDDPYFPRLSRRSVLGLLGAVPLATATVSAVSAVTRPAHATVRSAAGSAPDTTLKAKIEQIMARPEFQGAQWGAEFFALDSGESIYELNAGELFVAGSSSKVFVGGTAMLAFGADRRFATRVYRTGPVRGGVLKGDLVLVAGGDLLLSGRLRRSGSMLLPDPDHTYSATPGAGPIGGDPLQELRRLAAQIAGAGVKRVEGRVLVDTSLFREGSEKLANNVTATISPIMVNDNVVDVTVKPGPRSGRPAVLRISPRTDYVRIVNKVQTIAAADAASARPLTFTGDERHSDGSRTATLTGDIPADSEGLFRAYFVPEPAVFAEFLFTKVLGQAGVRVQSEKAGTDGRKLIAEYVGPALPQQLKPMLKVSSNLHTETFPYLVGAVAGGDADNAKAAGQRIRREIFTKAGLDPAPAGAADNNYTPRYFTRFLAYMARQPHFHDYRDALPIMGKDGSLADVQPDSPAAGHVYAKTGTSMGGPSGAGMVRKALAGYVELPGARLVAFAGFVGMSANGEQAQREISALTGQALGEMAATAYTTLGGSGAQ
ncbi:D-alanyl-D-alanine carboxypeptidase/D-alanyl-D-alanine-endopeptidase [Nonomuraea sp. B1E8]|uniref:D-alanyl-D-alanine carboxypeptidase/D-alanyl-D-alanine endopeptidase n=1 Tax=unclassified Nonomuraea TaxID=2593643 RepID=UPI00325CB5A8